MTELDAKDLKTRKKPLKKRRKKSPDNVELPLTLGEWKDMVSSQKPEEQYVQHLLPADPGSYGIIAGRTGIGKTNIMFNLGHSLATGSPFFGLKCRKVKVMMFAFEGGAKNLRERVMKIETQFPPVGDFFRFERLPKGNPAKSLLGIADKLVLGEPDVALIDPIKYLVTGSYIKPEDIDKFLLPFVKTLEDLGINSVISLPVTKPNNKAGIIQPEDIYTVKGGTEWVDSATFGMLIEKRAYKHSPDEVNIAFPKHREAEEELQAEDYVLNRDLCMYEKMFESDGASIIMRKAQKPKKSKKIKVKDSKTLKA